MPKEWELTSADYDIIDERLFHDPESEEYDKAIEHAARRKLLLFFIEHRNDTLEERTALFERLCRAHGLDEEDTILPESVLSQADPDIVMAMREEGDG